MSQTTFEALLLAYCCLTGFVAAGLIGSFYQLVTSQPPQFKIDVSGIIGSISMFALIMLVGPFILMRNALRGRRIEGRPVGWVVASSVIAAMWSAVSGLFVMQLALSIT